MQQHERGPRRRRARGRVVDRVPAEGRHHLVGLKPLRQVLGRGRAEQVAGLGEQVAVPLQPRGGRGGRGRAGAARARSGGVSSISGVISAATRRSSASISSEHPGVGVREPPHLLARTAEVVVELERRTVGVEVERRVRRGRRGSRARAGAGRARPARGACSARRRRSRRGTRGELLGDAAAADDRAARRPASATRPRRGRRRRPARCGRRPRPGVPAGSARAHASSCLIFARQ